jgi:hypothetical protein
MSVRRQVLDHASAAVTGTADPTWVAALLPPHTVQLLGLRSPASPPSSSWRSSPAHGRASAAAAELPPVLFRGLAAVVSPAASLVVRAQATSHLSVALLPVHVAHRPCSTTTTTTTTIVGLCEVTPLGVYTPAWLVELIIT